MGQDSFSDILPSGIKKPARIATNLATFGAPEVLGRTAALVGGKKQGKAIQTGFGLFSTPQVETPAGLNPDEERGISNEARAASFGLMDTGALGGRSREQAEREIFEKMVSDSIMKKEQAAADAADEELQAQQKISLIQKQRDALAAERTARPGARIQTTRSRRGFLA